MTNDQMSNDKLRQELEEYKQKAEDYLNSWKRTAADFENYKKRQEREAKELVRFAQEITVVKMLPTLESLEQALKQVPLEISRPEAAAAVPPAQGGFLTGQAPQDQRLRQWSDGIIKIVRQLEQTLLHMGIEKIKTAGEKFNPAIHEAVETIESDQESGTILEEVQSGYKLNNKIIRPAKVKVAR